MICPNQNCARIVSPFDGVCKNCGAILVDNPVRKYERQAEKIVIEGNIETGGLNNHLEHPLGGRTHGGFTANHGAGIRGVPSTQLSKEELANIPEEVKERMKHQILNWQKSYLMETYQTVFSNISIIENQEYRKKADETKLSFDADDAKVNGHAICLDDGSYEICIYGGYVNFAYAIATTYSESPVAVGLYDIDQLLEVVSRLKSNTGLFSLDDLIAILPVNREITDFGPNASMAIFQCIGHELGHICYGHVYSANPYKFRTSNANIEREIAADGFARQITDRSAFREQLWKGYIQFMIADTAALLYPGDGEPSLYDPETHPKQIERLKEAIRRFSDLAAKYNVKEQWAEEVINGLYRNLR